MEEYRRRKAEYAAALVARAALKKSIGSSLPNSVLPPLPDAPRMPRRSRKRNQPESSHANNDANNEPLYTEDDPDLRIHTSFRKDDDASIIDLSIAITNLTGRTISREQCQRSEFHLKRYLRTLASVSSFERCRLLNYSLKLC